MVGISLAGLKNYRLAVEAHRSALRIDGRLASSWHNLGYILGQRRQWRQAVPLYRRATETKPDWPRAWRDLGRALCHCGRHDEARAACRRALDLDPRSTATWRILGHVLDLENDGPGVLEVLERLRALDPALDCEPKSGDPNSDSNLGTH